MKISFSAATDWRLCQQRYAYRYIDGIEPLMKDTAPTLGRALHRYLEHFYTLQHASAQGDDFSVGVGMSISDAHKDALRVLDEDFAPELEGLAYAASAADQDELAQEFAELLPKAVNIATRYLYIHGAQDWNDNEVLAAEVKIEYPLTADITTPVVIDLITRNANGTFLWEHKSTKTVPPQTRRLKDLQTILYVAIAEEALNIHIDGIVWNYLRTKLPTEPRLLKDGSLTKRADLDSTWEVYQRAIKENGLDESDYEDVRLRLDGRELSEFFLRHTLPVLQSERILLRDFITTAQSIDHILSSGVSFTPVRNIGGHCDWCPFSRLCEAAILGGDERDLISRHYTLRKRKEVSDGDAGAN